MSSVASVSWAVEWEALDEMQDFAARYCRRSFPADLGERASFASNELLDNAVRYASAGTRIVYEVRAPATGFEIRVTNHAVETRLELLTRRVKEAASDKSGELYKKTLRKLLDQPDASHLSLGLGILRVRQEAAIELATEVVGRRVTVIATPLAVAQANDPRRKLSSRFAGASSDDPSSGVGVTVGSMQDAAARPRGSKTGG